jgi:hypothetical protein
VNLMIRPQNRSQPPNARRKAQKRFRDRDKAAGNVQVNVRVPKKHVEKLKCFVALLRNQKRPSEAFADTFKRAAENLRKQAASAHCKHNGQ